MAMKKACHKKMQLEESAQLSSVEVNRVNFLSDDISIVDRQLKQIETLKENLAKYQFIFEHLQDIYFSSLPDGTIIEISPSIWKLIGYTREELIGKSILNLYYNPDERRGIIDQLYNNGSIIGFELAIYHKDGRIVNVLLNAQLIKNDHSQPEKIVGSFCDITNRKVLEESLKNSERRLKEAERVTHMGYYEIDIISGIAKWSDETFRIFGLNPLTDHEPTVDDYLKFVHPHDLTLLSENFSESILKKRRFDLVYRIISANGTIKTVHSIGEIIVDQIGNAAKMFGTFHDISI
jgi:PAS domain S-box-containing protein